MTVPSCTDRSLVGSDSVVLVVGYGVHGQAVTDALVARGIRVLVVDDSATQTLRPGVTSVGVALTSAPSRAELAALVAEATHIVPTPGLPHFHPVFALAREQQAAVIGDFDLAAQWDDRPLLAITGTNGKTTVTTIVTQMLVASGRRAVSAGNLGLPLVNAIDDPGPETFVVEASSFRLAHSSTFAPKVGAWLNLEPDHLDVHGSMEAYCSAKARIWRNMDHSDLAIANANDSDVMGNLPDGTAVKTFGSAGSDAYAEDGMLVVAGEPLMATQDMPRSLPHDISNALAACLTAIGGGASRAAMIEVLAEFSGLQHRVEFVGELNGVRWYNDSKATTPHAVLAGVGGFGSAVLIAGGRNKGVDLAPLAALSPTLRGVVAIGEAADEVGDVFGDGTTVVRAGSMRLAVEAAATMARAGDSVVLSPACTSFDWYENYSSRGDDFTRLVRDFIGSAS